jgi:hypothetical protein
LAARITSLAEKPRPRERGVDVADKREKLEVEADLTLHLTEIVGVLRAHEAPVHVPASLARPDQKVRAPERLLQLLHWPPRLRALRDRLLRGVELPEQVADHLDPPGELPAGGPVPAYCLRRIGDHRDETVGVHSDELRDGGDLADQSHLARVPLVLGLNEQAG